MKNIIYKISSLLLVALMAMLIIGASQRSARAGQYDIIYAIRSTGTGAVLMPYLGTSGTWNVLPGTGTNGVLQTTGSGLAVNQGLQLSGTAAIATASGTNTLPAGILGLSSSNTLAISTGTGLGFRNAP
jgi:hypothetical protein